jgi:DNA-binding MarR family transcriptional regulator
MMMKSAIRFRTHRATQARLELGRLPRWEVQTYLLDKPGKSVYDISKDLGWTTGKAHTVIRTLEFANVVKSKKIESNGRIKKIVTLIK